MKKRHSKKALDKLLAKAEREMAEDASRLAQINDDGKKINRLAEVLARRTNAYGQTEMIIRMDASIPEHLFDRLRMQTETCSRVPTIRQPGDYGTAEEVHQCASRDIARYTGDTIDQVREHRKLEFIHDKGLPYFSTSGVGQELLPVAGKSVHCLHRGLLPRQ